MTRVPLRHMHRSEVLLMHELRHNTGAVHRTSDTPIAHDGGRLGEGTLQLLLCLFDDENLCVGKVIGAVVANLPG